MIIAIILTIATTFYVLAVFTAAFLLSKKTSNKKDKMPFVSVVIAARNEAKRIKPALDSLAMIDYPPDLHEVIWVDDNSVDATANFILDYVKDRSNWQLIKLQNKGQKFSGKKLALDTAIKQAKGEIILKIGAFKKTGLGQY